MATPVFLRSAYVQQHSPGSTLILLYAAIHIISNAMNILGVNPYYQYVMKGLLILISIYIGYLGSKRKGSR